MSKNRIRLTESDLHRVIKESVKKVMKEGNAYNDNIYGALSQDQIWSLVKKLLTKHLSNKFWIQDDDDVMYIEDYNTKEGISITMEYSASDFYGAPMNESKYKDFKNKQTKGKKY